MRHGRHWPKTSRLRPRAGRRRKCTGPVDRFRENPKMRVSQAGIAQLVERNLAKVEVASSSLVSRSRSMVVANPPKGLGDDSTRPRRRGFVLRVSPAVFRWRYRSPAWWQSGYAADCKSAYAGSIPTQASIGTGAEK